MLLSRREVGEDPGAPLAAARPLGSWWHSPASAIARFVPSGVLHAPSAGRRPPCKQLIMLSQKCRWDAPCAQRGLVARSGAGGRGPDESGDDAKGETKR